MYNYIYTYVNYLFNYIYTILGHLFLHHTGRKLAPGSLYSPVSSTGQAKYGKFKTLQSVHHPVCNPCTSA
jgi:hypothetical protein